MESSPVLDKVAWSGAGRSAQCKAALGPLHRPAKTLAWLQLPSVAGVAKLAYAPGLGPGPERGGGSSPLARTVEHRYRQA
jgi:hypothetical protein